MKEKNKREKSKIKNVLLEHIIVNKKEYCIALILFFVGVMIGVLFINNTSQTQGEEIIEYINTFINSFKENSNINKIELLKQSIIQNLGLAILLWFVGSTVIGMPIVCGIIIYRGFSLGYTIASIIISVGIGKGIIFSLITIALKNIIFIPSLLALCVSGFKLSKSILKDKRKENIKFEIYRHSFFSLLIVLLLIISSLIESYIVPVFLQFGIKII